MLTKPFDYLKKGFEYVPKLFSTQLHYAKDVTAEDNFPQTVDGIEWGIRFYSDNLPKTFCNTVRQVL